MPNINALDMAHYILKYALEKQIPITNLSYRSFCFFAMDGI